MKPTTIATLAIAGLLAACEPGSNSQYPQPDEPAAAPAEAPAGPADEAMNAEVGPGDRIHDAVIAAANVRLADQIGADVAIQPEIFRSQGDWAFLYGPIRMADGSEVDWAATQFADAAAEGMLDGDLGIVLLNWSDGGWRVVESAIAPTDAPQVAWLDRHEVAPALLGLEGG